MVLPVRPTRAPLLHRRLTPEDAFSYSRAQCPTPGAPFMARSDMSGLSSRPSLIADHKRPTALLKGTASAVPHNAPNEIGQGFSPATKTRVHRTQPLCRRPEWSAQRATTDLCACHNSLTAGQALLLFQPAAPAPSPAPPPHWLRTSTPRRPSSRGPARSPRNQPRSTTA